MSEVLEPRQTDDASTVTDAARDANGRIAEKAIRLRFLARVPFVCECSDPDCREFVLLLPQEYEAARREGYVTRPDHAVADAEPAPRDGYWVHAQRR